MPSVPPLIFDPFSEEFFHDPYPVYRRMQSEAPVYRNETRGFWALTRFDDVQTSARDWETFSNVGGVDLGRGVELMGPGGNFLDMDPPKHDELRRVVRDFFVPKTIARLKDVIQRRVDERIAEFAERKEADFGTELARPLPLEMVCELLGFPQQDQAELALLFLEMVQRTPGEVEVPRSARTAAEAMRSYIEGQAEERLRRPREDLLTRLVAAQADGSMSAAELVGTCNLMFLAGTSTASGLISAGLYHLWEHPDQRAGLVKAPATIPQAVEELVRYVSPVQALMRRTRREVKLHESTIPQGATVLLVFGAANRDPERFEDPDELRLGRKISRHLGFGEGIHFCLGAPLARLEMKTVLERLLSQIPDYQVAGPVRWMTVPGDRGIDRLPVRI